MVLMSDSEAWLISLRIANLTRSSPLSELSASANESTIAAGASGFWACFEIRVSEQVTDGAIERMQLIVAEVLDDARDVPGDDRFVHRRGIDQRQLVDVDFRKVGLVSGLAGNTVVDPATHAPLEFAHQRGPLRFERLARVHVDLLFVAHVGPTRAVHQHVGHLVHQCREREQQAMNGEIPAVGHDLRHFARHGPAGGRFGSRCVHPRGAEAVCTPHRPKTARFGRSLPERRTEARNFRTKIR